MKLSAAIRQLRKSRGLTQSAFAEKVGISRPSIAHFETEDRKPDAESLTKLCRAAIAASRLDLADTFAARIPGVANGLLIPNWRLPRSKNRQKDQRFTPR